MLLSLWCWTVVMQQCEELINTIFDFSFDLESYIQVIKECTSSYHTNSVHVHVILAKRYKYRVRENEVNIVQIVDDHYQRYNMYINQRDQFGSVYFMYIYYNKFVL